MMSKQQLFVLAITLGLSINTAIYAKPNTLTTPKIIVSVNQLPLTHVKKAKPHYHPGARRQKIKRAFHLNHPKQLKAERLIHKPLSSRQGKGSYWKWARYGKVPHGARILRFDNGKPVYGCHVKYKHKDYFGHIAKGNACVIKRNGKDVRMDHYLVLMK